MNPAPYRRVESSAGSVLAEARQELGMSVGDVARHLKLSPAQVEALEAGAYERLPGRVFVRGFLKNYAKLVGIDPQPLVRSIEIEIPPAAVADDRPRSAPVVMPLDHAPRWPIYAGAVAVVVVGALAVYEFGFNEPPQGAAQESAAQSASAAPTQADSLDLVDVPPGAPPSAEAQPDAFADAVPAQTERVPDDATAQASRGSGRELHFRFDEESWVEVRDAKGRIVFSKLNPAGTEQRVTAVPPLRLVVGNAHGVHLTYGDQQVDLVPHTGLTVARLTLQ